MVVNQVFFDANFAVGNSRGMGRYINAFITVLKAKRGIKAVGLLTAANSAKSYQSFGFRNYILWEQFSLPIFTRKRKSDLLICPYNTSSLFFTDYSNKVLVIHDLIFMSKFKSTSMKHWISKNYRKWILKLTVHRFSHIVTVSNFSRQRIAEFFNIDTQQISVIPNTVDLSSTNTNLDVALDSPYIFTISGDMTHKNLKGLIEAYRLFHQSYPDTGLKVVGVRDHEPYASYVKEFNGQLEFLAYQSNEEVSKLYQGAEFFVFSSFEEGFGIPLIEAMHHECPIACSDASCFPEVAGDAALFFDPYDFTDISEKMKLLKEDQDLRKQLVGAGARQVIKYVPENFERKVIDWYDKRFSG